MPNIELKSHFGSYQDLIENTLLELTENNVIARIWKNDHTVWKPHPTEITNRLGWLTIAERMQSEVDRMQALKEAVTRAGYTQILLLGMGGSSLAPEVFAKTFGSEVTGLDLAVLDSTDPGAVLAEAERLDLSKTLFIVSTKSGGTVETLSFFKFFYNRVLDELGEEQAGAHFVAITDPGSKLEILAEQFGFREVYLNDPNIGGRFSVLSYFGMVPATLVGLDVAQLLQHAINMAQACKEEIPTEENPGALLGAVMGALAIECIDKLTFVISPEISSFGDWVEQLIAESTGKEGRGILPVVSEPLGSAEVYGDDRVFVHLRLGDDDHDVPALKELAHAGYPVLHLQLADKYDLGGQFFLWEMATAVASTIMKINPFDQPNVESAKGMARQMVAAFQETGSLPTGESAPLKVEALADFIGDPVPGAYLAIQAYVTPTPEAEEILQSIRLKLRDTYKTATTLGFGPRFLHSTGQLHKGDTGNGLFIQVTSEAAIDLPIPDEAGHKPSSMSFQTLKMSQALGDAVALKAAGRRVIRFHIDDIKALARLSV